MKIHADGQTGRHTDTMSLIVTVCRFVNAPKIFIPYAKKTVI